MSMVVYIKGMEMPTTPVLFCVHPDGKVFADLEGEWRAYKAVPVPPHGDLIDRREAIIDANERAYDFWLSDDEVNATIQFLKEQPTIIPASEEG